MSEQWRDVPGFDGTYQVSDLGRVRRIAPEANTYTGRILRPEHMKDGYLRVTLYQRGKSRRYSIHRLVGYAFLGLTDEQWINHKNLIKSDNRLENLELSNLSHNVKHAFSMGVKMGPGVGEKHPNSKLTAEKVREMRSRFVAKSQTITEMAKAYGVSVSLVSLIVRHKKWTHI